MSRAPIDDATLSAALGRVVSIASGTEIGVGVGLLGNLWRIALTDGSRLVVKAPSTDPQTRAIAQHFGYYAREAGTYQFLLDGRGLPTPKMFGLIDAADGPTLVFEDLFDHRVADQLAGASFTDAGAAIDALARIHARFWDHPLLAVSPWLPGPLDAVVTQYEHLFAMTWESFCARVDGIIPRRHLDVATDVMARFAEVCATFANAPRTLVHGDFRLDNVLFAPDGTAAAIDWQLAAWGRGAYDIAFFASGSIDEHTLAENEDALLARYVTSLNGLGIESYGFAEAHHDYLGGLILNLPNPVTALVAVPPGSERGAALLLENARRALATVARHSSSLSSW